MNEIEVFGGSLIFDISFARLVVGAGTFSRDWNTEDSDGDRDLL